MLSHKNSDSWQSCERLIEVKVLYKKFLIRV